MRACDRGDDINRPWPRLPAPAGRHGAGHGPDPARIQSAGKATQRRLVRSDAGDDAGDNEGVVGHPQSRPCLPEAVPGLEKHLPRPEALDHPGPVPGQLIRE